MSRLPLPSLSFHARSAPASIHPLCSIFFYTNMIYLFFLSVFAFFNFQVAGFLCVIHSAIMARLVCCPCYSSGLDVLTSLEFRPCSSLIIFPRFSLSTILHLMSKAFFYITCISSIHQILFGDFVLLSFQYGCCDIYTFFVSTDTILDCRSLDFYS